MVYMMSTTRAGRPNKEKTPKTSHTHNSKTDGQQKFQPSSEQIRMAQMSKTTNKSTEDPEIEAKIEKLTELTGRPKEQAFFVLHDCDYDLNRAVEKLLENEDKGEWQEMKTKKKKSALKSESEPVIAEEINNTESSEATNHKEIDYSNDRPYDRSGSAPRNRRNDKAPPRFQRAGRGRNPNDDGDRFDRGDSQGRDRGRGRGRGGSRGRGRGRGGGGSYRRGDSNRDRGGSNFDDGPGLPIDTWTNEVAEEKKDNSFGNWGDMAEDWTTDEWQGNLKETTVFTSSEASKMFNNDNDAKMFSVTSIETQQTYNNTNSMPSPPRITENYQHSLQQSSLGPDPLQSLGAPQKPIGQNSMGQGSLGQNSIGQAPIGQNSNIGQSSQSMGQNSLGQRLDLGMLLSSKPTEYKAVDTVEAISQQTAELTKETADFMAQFQKNLAAESIKNAVGIGSSSSQSAGSLSLGQPSSHGQPSAGQSQVPSQQPSSQQPTQQQTSTSAAANQQSQPKQQRPVRSTTKLPPPSKIPASAVVMPGSGSGSSFGGSLDVEFGCFSESPGGFSFGSIPGAASTGVNNTYSSSSVSSTLNNHLNNKPEPPTVSSVMTSSTIAVTSQQQSAAMSAMLESMTQQQNSQSPRPAVFQNSTPATPPKDYTQSTKISSPPEPIPFPTSQTDRKSPYQSSGSLASEQTSTGQLNSYSQASYTNTAYPSSSYKSVPPPAITSSPSAGSSYSGNSNLAASSLTGSGLQNYQPSSFQSQQQSATVGSGYSSGSSHQGSGSSLYQSTTNPPSQSSFQSQNASYNNQSSGGVSGVSYQTQNSYHHTRDSQSAPAFQSTGVTQSGSSSYQSSANQSNSASYQRDNSQSGVSQSGYGSQLNYGSVSVSGQNSGLSSSKLSESLGKLTVKDNSNGSASASSSGSKSNSLVDKSSLSAGVQYDNSSTPSVNNGAGVMGASSHSTSTNTPASSIATGSVTVSTAMGIPTNNSVASVGSVSASALSSSSTSSSASKSSVPVTTKAPLGIPPGMPPLIGHGQTNYMIGQPGFPIAAFGLQQPMYSYEDLLHQRLPMHGFNYDNIASYQHTANTLSGLDQNKLAAAAAASYSAADVSKLNRLEAQSPVNAQSSQPNTQSAQQTSQQQQQQTQQQTAQSAAHGQAFIPNPTAGLPGYYNYYVGGLPQAGYSYPTPFLPVNNLMPTVTNASVATTNTQFQKPAYNYGTGYDSLSAMSGQTHDFSKAYGAAASQTQNKTSASLAAVSSNSDLSGGAATGYPKAHQQTSAAFEKSGFAAGTPPPFGLPPGLPVGTQAGALSGTPYMAQYAMPAGMAHPGQMLHQLHQDTSGSSSRATQQSTSQPKSMVGTKAPGYAGHTGYWGN